MVFGIQLWLLTCVTLCYPVLPCGVTLCDPVVLPCVTLCYPVVLTFGVTLWCYPM